MLTPVAVKFIPIMHLYWDVLEIKGCLGLQNNILQIADFLCQVVFLLFLPCF